MYTKEDNKTSRKLTKIKPYLLFVSSLKSLEDLWTECLNIFSHLLSQVPKLDLDWLFSNTMSLGKVNNLDFPFLSLFLMKNKNVTQENISPNYWKKKNL